MERIRSKGSAAEVGRLYDSTPVRRGFRWLWQGLLVLSLALGVWAQTPAPATTPGESVRPLGVVTTVDAAGKQITLKTDAGPELAVRWQDNTTFLRVPPGEKDLKNAAKISVSDIGVGDRILVRGRVSEDQK